VDPKGAPPLKGDLQGLQGEPIQNAGPAGASKQAGILLLYLGLALIMTYPLLVVFARGVLGPPGDNFEYLYKLWWFKRSLFDLKVSPFFTGDIFYPDGYHLALHEMSLANVSLGMPLTILGGETVAYNALVLLSFVLSGFGTYLLVVRWTRDRWAAVFSGIAFAFCSYRLAHLGAGHLNLLGTQWLPFLFLCLDRLLHAGQMSSAILAGIFFALAALSSWYYAPITALFAAVYVLWRRYRHPPTLRYGDAAQRPARAEPAGRRDTCCPAGVNAWRHEHSLSMRRLWLLLAVTIAVASVLMLPGLVPTVQQWSQREMSFSLREVDIFSASVGDWIVPNWMQPVWGRLVAPYYAHRQDVLEYVISLSWVSLALAAIGLCYAWRHEYSAWRHEYSNRIGSSARLCRSAPVTAYVLLLALSLLLAMGTTLHLAGQRVYLQVPAWIERGFTALMGLLANRLALHPMPSYYELRQAGAIYLPLPTLLLYLYLPFFDAMRVWTRFGLISAFALAVLSGLGMARLSFAALRTGSSWDRESAVRPAHDGGVNGTTGRRRGTARRRGWLTWLCLGAILLELAPVPYALGWSEVRTQPVDQWLAQQVEEGAVVQLPLWRAECGPGLYAAAVHQKPVVYGYGAFFPRRYRQLRPLLWDFPSAQGLGLLQEWGVRYVLVGAQSYGAQWPEIQQRLGQFEELALAAVFDQVPVYHSGWLTEVLSDLSHTLIVDRIYVYRLG